MRSFGKALFTLTNLRIVTDPIFFPNAAPEKHRVIIRVVKPCVDYSRIARYPLKPLTLMFWGTQAEEAALLLEKEKMIAIDVVGRFRVVSLLNKEGKLKANLYFNVYDCDFRDASLDWFCQRYREFEMSEVLDTGKFGNAKVWTIGQGWVNQVTAVA